MKFPVSYMSIDFGSGRTRPAGHTVTKKKSSCIVIKARFVFAFLSY